MNRIFWIKDGYEALKDDSEDDSETFDEKEGPQLIPILDASQSTLKSFDDINYWIGHTNFRLNQRHLDYLDDVDGVEIVQFPTEYRIIIAIAKLFDEDTVKKEITDLFCGQSNENIEDIPQEVKKELDWLNGSRLWFLYMAPDGSYVYDRIEDHKSEKDYWDHYESCSKDYHSSGGNMYTQETYGNRDS